MVTAILTYIGSAILGGIVHAILAKLWLKIKPSVKKIEAKV